MLRTNKWIIENDLIGIGTAQCQRQGLNREALGNPSLWIEHFKVT
jgi:hypothetical protein